MFNSFFDQSFLFSCPFSSFSVLYKMEEENNSLDGAKEPNQIDEEAQEVEEIVEHQQEM